MATTVPDIARRLLWTLACPILALASAACSCPPLVDNYGTPERTLASWQSRLCRDDAAGEYACLAASFQRRMGGFSTYHAARSALLDEQAAAAWLFERADLADHITLTQYTPDGLAAFLELEALGERVAVSFELETWLTLTWADGPPETLRQDAPLAKLLGSQLGRQWLTILRPELPPERLADVRALSIETRWKISDISGLVASPASGTMP